ncbi:unnamed protein product, partial [Brassica oleracea]
FNHRARYVLLDPAPEGQQHHGFFCFSLKDNASIIYPTEIIKAAQPGWWLRWKNWKRNFKKPNGLNRGNVL